MASDNSDKILCQGWLQKRGREGLNALSTIASSIGGALGSLGLWKQRFCRLSVKEFKYYAQEDEKTLRGSIDCSQITTVSHSGNYFDVETPKRTYYFWTKTSADAQLWTDKLKDVISTWKMLRDVRKSQVKERGLKTASRKIASAAISLTEHLCDEKKRLQFGCRLISCPNVNSEDSNDKCPWKGYECQLSIHECDYKLVPCGICPNMVSFKALDHHQNDLCDYRIVDCKNGCGFAGRSYSMNAHRCPISDTNETEFFMDFLKEVENKYQQHQQQQNSHQSQTSEFSTPSSRPASENEAVGNNNNNNRQSINSEVSLPASLISHSPSQTPKLIKPNDIIYKKVNYMNEQVRNLKLQLMKYEERTLIKLLTGNTVAIRDAFDKSISAILRLCSIGSFVGGETTSEPSLQILKDTIRAEHQILHNEVTSMWFVQDPQIVGTVLHKLLLDKVEQPITDWVQKLFVEKMNVYQQRIIDFALVTPEQLGIKEKFRSKTTTGEYVFAAGTLSLLFQLSSFTGLLDKISCLKTCVHQINSSVINNYNHYAADNDSDDEHQHQSTTTTTQEGVVVAPSPRTRHQSRFVGVTAEELLPMIIYCLIRSGLKSLYMDIQLASLANLDDFGETSYVMASYECAIDKIMKSPTMKELLG